MRLPTADINVHNSLDERLLLSYSPHFRKIVDAARRQFRAGQGVPHDEFWRMVQDDQSARPKRTVRKQA